MRAVGRVNNWSTNYKSSTLKDHIHIEQKKYVKRMTINKHRAQFKSFHVAYLIAQKGHAVTIGLQGVEVQFGSCF